MGVKRAVPCYFKKRTGIYLFFTHARTHRSRSIPVVHLSQQCVLTHSFKREAFNSQIEARGRPRCSSQRDERNLWTREIAQAQSKAKRPHTPVPRDTYIHDFVGVVVRKPA